LFFIKQAAFSAIADGRLTIADCDKYRQTIQGFLKVLVALGDKQSAVTITSHFSSVGRATDL